MKPIQFAITFVSTCLILVSSTSAQLNKQNNTSKHEGFWITCPTAGKENYGVFNFRKIITLSNKPDRFKIKISADPRFRLFVNGVSVAVGSARSDVAHWRYQTVDIADQLINGENILAAVVWNDGADKAWAQMSFQTGFYIQGESEEETIANTDTSWKVVENTAYSPNATIDHITGAFENFFAQRYPWGWKELEFNDSIWPRAQISEKAYFTSQNNNVKRVLMQQNIPSPEEKEQRFFSIRSVNGSRKNITDSFLKGTGSLKINPWSQVTILIDQEHLTTAYSKLLLSGGRGAKITITYAESLYDDNGLKGDRNIIAGKKIRGNEDIYLADGGYKRLYSPLYYRTFRYVELHIENHQEPLEINDFYSVFTAYPFKQVATFKCNDSVLNKIFETGWRTARLCAFETYMDCPYYEQLQYVGDTRIQALISLYVSGDDRLMRNAIEQINYSTLPEGITQSRYPSSNLQVIPPFSLFWISMLHDYWMLRKDDDFIRSLLPSVKKILDWHKKYINENNMLGPMPYWNFVDWAKEWPWTGNENGSGVPDGTRTGNSSILTLQYVMALQKATDLFNYFKLKNDAGAFLNTANELKTAVLNYCWNNDKKLLANTISKNTFSQHAQALGVLTGTFPKAEEKEILLRTISDTTLIQCTYYYKFYLFQALKKAGMANEYIGQLSPWKNMLALHLSTFAEAPEPSRSDCHGWSASPCYDLLATVCGINSSEPGFEKVIINPHLGSLTTCEASVPHPLGVIFVSYKKLGEKNWEININLPQKLTGYLQWGGKNIKLKSGTNSFKLQQPDFDDSVGN